MKKIYCDICNKEFEPTETLAVEVCITDYDRKDRYFCDFDICGDCLGSFNFPAEPKDKILISTISKMKIWDHVLKRKKAADER